MNNPYANTYSTTILPSHVARVNRKRSRSPVRAQYAFQKSHYPPAKKRNKRKKNFNRNSGRHSRHDNLPKASKPFIKAATPGVLSKSVPTTPLVSITRVSTTTLKESVQPQHSPLVHLKKMMCQLKQLILASGSLTSPMSEYKRLYSAFYDMELWTTFDPINGMVDIKGKKENNQPFHLTFSLKDVASVDLFKKSLDFEQYLARLEKEQSLFDQQRVLEKEKLLTEKRVKELQAEKNEASEEEEGGKFDLDKLTELKRGELQILEIEQKMRHIDNELLELEKIPAPETDEDLNITEVPEEVEEETIQQMMDSEMSGADKEAEANKAADQSTLSGQEGDDVGFLTAPPGDSSDSTEAAKKVSKIPIEAEIVDLTLDDDELETSLVPQQYRVLFTFKKPVGKMLSTTYTTLKSIRNDTQIVILDIEKPDNIMEFDASMERFLKHTCTHLNNRKKWSLKKKRDRVMSNLVKDAAEIKKRDFEFEKCPNGCSAEDRFFRLTIHTTLHCPLRQKICRYCKTTLTAQEIKAHLKECPSLPTMCLNKCSGRKIKRSEMDNHLAIACPLTQVQCEFAHFGCKSTIPRNQSSHHNARSLSNHFKLVINAYDDLKGEHDVLDSKLELMHTFLSSKFDDFPPEIAQPLDDDISNGEDNINGDIVEKDEDSEPLENPESTTGITEDEITEDTIIENTSVEEVVEHTEEENEMVVEEVAKQPEENEMVVEEIVVCAEEENEMVVEEPALTTQTLEIRTDEQGTTISEA